MNEELKNKSVGCDFNWELVSRVAVWGATRGRDVVNQLSPRAAQFSRTIQRLSRCRFFHTAIRRTDGSISVRAPVGPSGRLLGLSRGFTAGLRELDQPRPHIS